jgi:hypothetical protein
MGYQPKKATFTVARDSKNQRIFTAVNRRAKFVCKRLGKRTKLTESDMRKAKTMGSYKLYAYNAAGVRQPVRV